MKVTTFRLENVKYINEGHPVFDNSDAVFHLPTLPAYAAHHTKVDLDHPINIDAGYLPPKHIVKNDKVVLEGVGLGTCFITGQLAGWLTIYHSGIKDYSFLFPYIENESLRTRLGQFAQEAESAFESQSWMSYVLMVGAVVEGLLFDQFGNNRFVDLISQAEREGVITQDEVPLFNEVRGLRNRIHADNYEKPFANREIAMELSVIYERLLKRVWVNGG